MRCIAFAIALVLSACGGGNKSNQHAEIDTSPVDSAPMSKPQTASSDQMPPAGDPLWAIPPDRSPLWQEIDPKTLKPV
jgi:uncharacterized lipoprotein